MKKGITTWFAAAALAGLTIAFNDPGAVVAQPPGRGPGGPDGQGRGGPPNVGELFSRMDKDEDGKLTQDEVPGPVWSRLSNADANDDGAVTKEEATKAMSGRRPDGGRAASGRPDGPPSDRSRESQSRSRDGRPPMERERSESSHDRTRGHRDASPGRGRPASPRSPNQSDRDRSSRTDNAHHRPSSFGPDAFFNRLDKNGDGSLSRDEFKAVAGFHRGQQYGTSGHRGGAPNAHRGPDMRGGGPPWARDNRGNSFGPSRFQGGPPWARSGHGPRVNTRFAGPPWARSAQRDHRSRHRASHRGPRHRDTESRGRRSHDRGRSSSRGPDHRQRTGANAPRSDFDITTEDSLLASQSDDSVTSSTPAKTPDTATLPL